jgi:hypothetical protein
MSYIPDLKKREELEKMNLADEIQEVSDIELESDKRESLRQKVSVARLSRVPQAPK